MMAIVITGGDPGEYFALLIVTNYGTYDYLGASPGDHNGNLAGQAKGMAGNYAGKLGAMTGWYAPEEFGLAMEML